jgi:hypothetical protein
MLTRRRVAIVIPAIVGALLLIQLQARAATAQNSTWLRELSTQATDQDPAVATAAVAQLRAAGPAGLAALIDANSEAVRQRRAGMVPLPPDPRWLRIAAAIDAVAAQKDAWASGLYWYTDLEAAKAAAKDSGKPILSLRLLGTLDTEFSCANSRFFRTVLYANGEVSKTLSERFILHWKSVRPVPKVTIDFGDGRVVERTITGNSIHYVLDSEGRVIDGIPGLYGPKMFLRLINEDANCARDRNVINNPTVHQNWHTLKANQILVQWQEELRQVGAIPVQPVVSMQRQMKAFPAATVAGQRAIGKGFVEGPLVAAITPDARKLEAASDEQTWTKLAALHAEDSRLDQASRVLMVAKNPDALAAGRLAVSKRVVENPLVKIVQNFERSIAEDTVRNEYLFHRRIHTWLAEGKLPDGRPASDVDCLNERVYADLFLTPSSDPWLGLLPPDTYSALPNDGLCRTK